MPDGIEYLFVYGTLTDPHIREQVFGRQPVSEKDSLAGFVRLDGTVGGRYPEVVPDDGAEAQVSGLCLELTPGELRHADAYETRLYYRVRKRLDSGREAWIYLASESKPLPK